MKLLADLFLTFCRIGSFTFGGGYAMLPLIERDVVERKKWLSKEEFLDVFAVSQSLPGVFAVNMSVFIGYKLRGVWGGVVAALGTIFPSFLILLLIAVFFTRIRENVWVVKIMSGIRPAVVAMIAAPVLSTWKAMKVSAGLLWIPVLSALSVWYAGVSPVWIILAAALGGILYFVIIGRAAHRKRHKEE